jgi:mersacidin/lichenicidin family type 2 lantibiotic
MSTLQIVRAWKDETYRRSLTQEQLAELPEHPAGSIEFDGGAVAVQTNGKKCETPGGTIYCTVWCTAYTACVVGGASTCA